MNRRKYLEYLIATGLVLATESIAGPVRRGAGRRHARRVRRRIRRRFRRRVVFRTITGRRVLVVPVGCAVGWELALDDRVVVVREVKVVEVDGEKRNIVVVKGPKDKIEEIEIIREDTDENSKELQGSEIGEGDTDTPGIETEE